MKAEPIYLESDEEITAAIAKLGSSEAKSVALVVPKRSTLLQSLVNLKLLQKAAQDADKELVLVTGDRTASRLAGSIGLPVAATLKDTPAVPQVPEGDLPAEEVIQAETPPEPATDDQEADAEPTPTEEAMADAAAAKASKKPDFAKPMLVRKGAGGKSGGPKVPDFNALNKRVVWVGAALVVVLLLLLGNFLLKSAHVTIFEKGTEVPVSFDLAIDQSAKTDSSKAVLAAQQLSQDKDLSSTFTATGKKDAGTKATGTVTVTNNCYNPGTLAAGTVFTSSSGLKFVSTQDIAVPNAIPAFGHCSSTSASVPVQASQNGDQYNLAPTSYTVGSAPSSQLSGQGNQMSGGTTKNLTVVTQADVDKAKQALLDQNHDQIQKDLEATASNGAKAIGDSFAAQVTAITSSPAVDNEATNATLTLKVSYTELAVQQSDLDDVINTQEQQSLTNQNQIFDTGSASASITKNTGKTNSYHLSATAFAGAKLDKTALAKQVAGKKYGDAATLLSGQPGVDSVQISLWPSFSTTLPHSASKITVDIKVAGK